MKKTRQRIFLAAVCVFVCIVCVEWLGVFSFLENKSYDHRMQQTARFYRAHDNVVFVMLNQDSLDWAKEKRGWGWPWPRAAYGEIVSYFNVAGANSVSFDVLFTEPSLYGPEDDAAFAAANAEFGKTILAVDFSQKHITNEISVWDPILPVEPIKSSAALLANVQSAKDSDDVIRRSRYGFFCKDVFYPTMGLAPFYVNESKKPSVITLNGAKNATRANETVQLRFASSIDEYIPYSARHILQSYQMVQDCQAKGITKKYRETGMFDRLLEPELFTDANIFFGFYAPGLFDICSSPVSQVYPSVGVHLSLYDTILNDSEIYKIPTVFLVLFFLMCTVLGIFPVLFFKRISTKIISSLMGFVIIVMTVYALFIPGVWVPLVTSLLCYIGSFAAAIIVEYQAVGYQRRYLKSAFSQYLSPAVIENLIENPEQLKLGGERREISIYFSDIQGFTTISEKLDPEELTALLNEYLTEMSNIILESGGTIDKYQGDAIIAFWNAPADQPEHAKKAVEVAIACQNRLKVLALQLEKRAGSIIKQRIGLNTGAAVVGNLGSDKRFDYTMIGDAVNIAARLEGLNKQFGTYTMCTDYLRKKALEKGATISFIEIARVTVVGKKQAVIVYEPISHSEYEARKPVFDIFDKARNFFYEGALGDALKLFESISSKQADLQKTHPAAFKYAEKCRELINYFCTTNVKECAVEEARSWEGVWVATQK
ncbi:MAG TPA: adenylate/guanylate cyclase domain-containing protein [Treponemataceae bacterium]|nr:adenylate/guanylate cyclase domain-containing protein [Treponemataceae bacterium]